MKRGGFPLLFSLPFFPRNLTRQETKAYETAQVHPLSPLFSSIIGIDHLLLPAFIQWRLPLKEWKCSRPPLEPSLFHLLPFGGAIGRRGKGGRGVGGSLRGREETGRGGGDRGDPQEEGRKGSRRGEERERGIIAPGVIRISFNAFLCCVIL